jgi:hypothetical protein
VVVLNEGESVTGEELIRFGRGRLATSKSSKSSVFRNNLPGNGMGKIQKAGLGREA